jgi:branched-chain amino acid aminotransferase
VTPSISRIIVEGLCRAPADGWRLTHTPLQQNNLRYPRNPRFEPMLQKFDERNRDLIVNINGELVHRDKAGINPFDSAVQGGDAVWEGLRLYAGRIFKLHEHLNRLERSARALSFAAIPAREKIIDQIKRTLAANKMRDGVHIRLTLTRGVKVTSGMDPRLNQSGPTLIVLAEHKAPVYAKTGLTLITSKIRRPPPEVLDARIHHANLLNSILAKIEANNAGADDALMLDTRGFVAETNATHVFIVRNADLATSRVVACPEGITRATIIEICAAEKIRCVEKDLSLDDIYGADEMFCTGTMGELAGVVRVDNRHIGQGKVGPMTKRLSDLYAKRTAAEGVQVL